MQLPLARFCESKAGGLPDERVVREMRMRFEGEKVVGFSYGMLDMACVKLKPTSLPGTELPPSGTSA